MRVRFRHCFGFLATMMALPLSAQAQAPCRGPRDACEFVDAFLSALNRRDWEAFRGAFADDITVIFDQPGPPERQEGRAAVEAVFQNIFPRPGSAPEPLPAPLQPESLLVQSLGDVAVVSFHLRRPDRLSRRTLILHRTAAGWKVVHIHGSSVPLPAP